MPNVIINGLKFSYDFNSPKNPTQTIILVHGAGGNKRHWSHQVLKLGKKYLTIAVDLPGHGESEGQACDNIQDYSNFIYDLAERVVGSPFFLAGHSMGGAIAMDFAIRFTSQINGLILIGTGARLRVAPTILDTFAEGKHFNEMVHFAYGKGASSEMINMARQEMVNTKPIVYYKDFYACNEFDLMDQVGIIEKPTLILGATQDKLTPLQYSHFLAQNIKSSTLKIIDEAGHMMMIEKPNKVNYNIKQFLNSYKQ